MKNLDLKQIGVQELSTVEKRDVDGGLFGVIVAACAVAGTISMWAFDKGEAIGRALA